MGRPTSITHSLLYRGVRKRPEPVKGPRPFLIHLIAERMSLPMPLAFPLLRRVAFLQHYPGNFGRD